MIRFEAANIQAAIGYLSGSVSDWKVHIQLLNNGSISPLYLSRDMRVWFLKSLERIRDSAKELDMIVSTASAQRAFDECIDIFSSERRYSAFELQKLIAHADKVVHAYGDEIRGRLVFVMPAKHSAFFGDDAHFGYDVEEAFPSASYDINEAAKCLSLGRWTACVMHTMRVLEMGLAALASHFDVDAGGNWNTALNQIEAKAREVSKRTDGPEAEQWAAEAGTHLRFIKNAWRNHAMHPREKYDEARAIAIFQNARSFMCHLSGRLCE